MTDIAYNRYNIMPGSMTFGYVLVVGKTPKFFMMIRTLYVCILYVVIAEKPEQQRNIIQCDKIGPSTLGHHHGTIMRFSHTKIVSYGYVLKHVLILCLGRDRGYLKKRVNHTILNP